MDGDTAIGLDPTKFSEISTDTYGDLLKYQGEVLYIIDDKDTEIATDDSVIEIVDAWDHTPWFDYQESWGTGDYIQEDSRAAFAVESFDDINGNKNFLLGIKQESSFGGGETETFWETFRIKEENPGENDWYLDWDSGSFSKGARRLEAKFNQDLNGNDQIDSGSISTTNVLTDQSSTGQRGAALAMDDEGSLYIKQGTGNPILIEDNYGPVTFDYSETWGSYSRTSSAYAVEGILNDAGDIAKYKLAVRYQETNLKTTSTTTFWETYLISTTGEIDWNSGTWGSSAKTHEVDLNQDLDGVDGIWTSSKLTYDAVSTDTVGDRPYLDDQNNLYIQPSGATTKNAVLTESGDPFNSDFSDSFGGYTFDQKIVAAKSITIGSDDYYKILLQYDFTEETARSLNTER